MLWKTLRETLKEDPSRSGWSWDVAQLWEGAAQPGGSAQQLPTHGVCKAPSPTPDSLQSAGPAPKAFKKTHLHPRPPNERHQHKQTPRQTENLFLDE